MIRWAMAHALLATAFVLTLPTVVTAQAADPTLEGVDWHLTGYGPDGATPVPWTVDPSLRLEDGSASGSGGCNDFGGSYTLEGDTLSFDPTMTMTRMACPQPAATVEDAYMAALPQVAGWSIEDDALELSDLEGTVILQYEQAVAALTSNDVAQLTALLQQQQTGIDELQQRIDNIRISVLRDRIKELETTVATLQAQAPASSPAFSNTEQVLLKAIPQPVKRTCQPLRSGLPAGTAAAVACDGSSAAVAEQAYYLMEWRDAVSTLRSVASSKGVPNRNPRCFAQRAGWIHYGTNLGAEACWSENGQGNYRLVTMATNCKQLDVAGTRLKQPAIYLAMEGVNDRMEPLRAAGLAYTDAGWLIMNFEAGGYIPAGNQPNSPGCKARLAQAGGL